jgi:hypothetical protein
MFTLRKPFAIQEADYLRHSLSFTGIEPQSKMILVFFAFSEPKNKRQLKRFLGFVKFFRK